MSKVLFKKTAKQIILVRSYNHAVIENIDQRKSFKKMEDYLSSSYLMVSSSFDDYMTGSWTNRRMMRVVLIKLAQALFIMRYALSIVYGQNEYLRYRILADGNEILGNRVLISSVLCLGHVVTFFFSMTIIWLEFNSKFTIITYLYEIKSLVTDVPLNCKYRRKYFKLMNRITKHLSWPFLAQMCTQSFVLFALPLLWVSLTDSSSQYSLISVMLWTPITLVAIFDFNAHVLGKCHLLNGPHWYNYWYNHGQRIGGGWKIADLPHTLSLLEKSLT